MGCGLFLGVGNAKMVVVCGCSKVDSNRERLKSERINSFEVIGIP